MFFVPANGDNSRRFVVLKLQLSRMPRCDGTGPTCDGCLSSCDGLPPTCGAPPRSCDGDFRPATAFLRVATPFRGLATPETPLQRPIFELRRQNGFVRCATQNHSRQELMLGIILQQETGSAAMVAADLNLRPLFALLASSCLH